MTRPAPTGLLRNRSGATAVEFALVIGPLMVLLLGFLDMGHRMFLAAHVQGTVQQAARYAAIGTNDPARNLDQEIDRYVHRSLSPLSRARHVSIDKRSYLNFSDIGRPEQLTTDRAAPGVLDPGDCWRDSNGNNSFDLTRARDGIGGADDVLQYRVTVRYRRLVPLGGFLSWSDDAEVSASTIIRNQPFATQRVAGIICRPA